MTRIARNDNLIESLIVDEMYDIRNDGTIWTFKSGNGTVKSTMRPISFTKSNGYLGFRYRNKFLLLHRIIYRKFVGKICPYMVINHKDGVRNNNSLENLELVSYSENNRHAYEVLKRESKKLYGTDNHQAKFTKDQVDEIRKNFDNKIMDISQLSKNYNVCRLTMRNIVSRKTYI